jgi:hypothetical protein
MVSRLRTPAGRERRRPDLHHVPREHCIPQAVGSFGAQVAPRLGAHRIPLLRDQVLLVAHVP